MLSNEWTVRDFYPIAYLPRCIRLCAYSGDASDLPAPVLQDFLDRVRAGTAKVPIDQICGLDEIVEVHRRMENNEASGKMVVIT
jgi:NADPH:quinone reductase-like Zn-dependent oxidoreductase